MDSNLEIYEATSCETLAISWIPLPGQSVRSGPWHCPEWNNRTFFRLVPLLWRMVSELTLHNGRNLLFLPTIFILWFCPHSQHTRQWLPRSQKETLMKCVGISRKAVFLILAIYIWCNSCFFWEKLESWIKKSISHKFLKQLMVPASHFLVWRNESMYSSHFIWEQF
jgi:hypothetical protein